MSLITTTNKHAFKEWLREYKKMFGADPIIPDYMGLVSKFLTILTDIIVISKCYFSNKASEI